MSGREISSTLRNLKFMQRAAQKEEKKEDEEVLSNGGFGFSPAISKKCVVIMEGDPHPGAVKGRMSFQSFNPSVDKLAEEVENCSDPGASNSNSNSENCASGFMEGTTNEDTNKDHKRKQPVKETEESQYPNKSLKNIHDYREARASSSKKKNSSNKKKNEKNNWSVLRPSKSRGMSE